MTEEIHEIILSPESIRAIAQEAANMVKKQLLLDDKIEIDPDQLNKLADKVSTRLDSTVDYDKIKNTHLSEIKKVEDKFRNYELTDQDRVDIAEMALTELDLSEEIKSTLARSFVSKSFFNQKIGGLMQLVKNNKGRAGTAGISGKEMIEEINKVLGTDWQIGGGGVTSVDGRTGTVTLGDLYANTSGSSIVDQIAVASDASGNVKFAPVTIDPATGDVNILNGFLYLSESGVVKVTSDGLPTGTTRGLFLIDSDGVFSLRHGVDIDLSIVADATSVLIYPATQSTGADTGSLQVKGGGWFAKDVFIDGDLDLQNGDLNLQNGELKIGGNPVLSRLGNLVVVAGMASDLASKDVFVVGDLEVSGQTRMSPVAGGDVLKIGISTDASSPGVTVVSENSGFAAPSNVNAVSLGDKWIFWNSSAYKGAIGFDMRTMWFQSTENASTDNNRFKFFAGSASSPIEILVLGDGAVGFKWNDTGIDIDFLVKAVGVADALFVDGANGEITLGQLTLGVVQADADGKLTSSPTLADGTLATTQSQADNSAKLATTGYVDIATSKAYAEMFFDNNGVAQVMSAANQPHGVFNYTAGLSQFWVFYVAGSSAAITAYADYSGTVAGTVKVTTSASHGVSEGAYVVQHDSTNYNGVFLATSIDSTNYYITHSWDGDDGASNMEIPSTLRSGAQTTRTYLLEWNVSVTKAAGTLAIVTFVCYVNDVPQIKTTGRQEIPSTGVASMGGGSLLSVASGDRVFLTVESTNGNDLTMSHGSLRITEF